MSIWIYVKHNINDIYCITKTIACKIDWFDQKRFYSGVLTTNVVKTPSEIMAHPLFAYTFHILLAWNQQI